MSILDEFRRYTSLIEGLLRPGEPFIEKCESASAVQVERGIVLERAVMRPADPDFDAVERLIELARGGDLARMAFVDRGNHHRPLYRPLAIYAWLSAFALEYEI